MLNFFLGSVFKQQGMMGTDPQTAAQLGVTLGSFALKPKTTHHWIHRYHHCFNLHYKINIFFFWQRFFSFHWICVFTQMDTMTKVFLTDLLPNVWAQGLNLRVKQKDGFSEKAVLVNRFGLYEALAGCRGGQGEVLPSCRDNRTLQTPRPPPHPPPEAPIVGVGPSWTAVVGSSL